MDVIEGFQILEKLLSMSRGTVMPQEETKHKTTQYTDVSHFHHSTTQQDTAKGRRHTPLSFHLWQNNRQQLHTQCVPRISTRSMVSLRAGCLVMFFSYFFPPRWRPSYIFLYAETGMIYRTAPVDYRWLPQTQGSECNSLSCLSWIRSGGYVCLYLTTTLC